MSSFTASVRALIDELNANAAAGLITQRVLVLINLVQQELVKAEHETNQD